MKMQPSQNCFKLVKHYEKFMPGPYLCPAGVPTIGYGTTVYPDGREVRLTDKKITEPLACEFLEHDIERFSEGVNSLVKVPITQGMHDALTSFAYNVGLDIDTDNIAEGLGDSTLLKLLNAGAPVMKVNAEFLKWTKARRKGKLVSLAGLEARRRAEAWLAFNLELKFFTA